MDLVEIVFIFYASSNTVFIIFMIWAQLQGRKLALRREHRDIEQEIEWSRVIKCLIELELKVIRQEKRLGDIDEMVRKKSEE